MNRADFQALAAVRLKEARILLDQACFDGAYYLAGYVVECALKACIARLTAADDFPPPPREVQDMYTHDLARLLHAAGLELLFEADMQRDTVLADSWRAVKRWSEQSRYQRPTEHEARLLYEAITDSGHGVLQWLQLHW